jgi:hypothetical protein
MIMNCIFYRMNIQAQKSLISYFLQVQQTQRQQQKKRRPIIDFYRFLNRCHTIEGNKCLRHVKSCFFF